MTLNQTLIRFPELTMRTRDAHKLRGYFGNLFKEHSPLLHNHYDDGTLRYAYPLVQYKVIDGIPVLTGIGAGAELLIDLFLKIKKIQIEHKEYPVLSKNIENRIVDFRETSELISYSFVTLWMGLNEKNHNRYLTMAGEEKKKLLNRILTGNILSFYKGIGFHVQREILLTSELEEKRTKFKNIDMLAFTGDFICNAILAEYIGLGKAVSRGFGTIIKKK